MLEGLSKTLSMKALLKYMHGGNIIHYCFKIFKSKVNRNGKINTLTISNETYGRKNQTPKIIKDIEDLHFTTKKLNYITHIGLYINKFRMSIFSNVNGKFTKYTLCWTIVKTTIFKG